MRSIEKDTIDSSFLPNVRQPRRLASMTNHENTITAYQSINSEDYVLPEEAAHPLLIRVHKRFRAFWNFLMVLTAIYIGIVVPYFIAFEKNFGSNFLTIFLVIDGIYLIDVILNFNTTFIDDDGEVSIRTRIYKNYLKKSFAIDILSLFPFDVIVAWTGNQLSRYYFLTLLVSLLKINKLFRASDIIRNWEVHEDVKAWAKIFKLFVYLFLWVHFNACIWFIVVNETKVWTTILSNYKVVQNFYELDYFSQYYICFYYGVWLTLGNQVSPRDESQSILASILIIIGIVGTSILLGEMAVIIASLNRQQLLYQEYADNAMLNLQNIGIPEQLIDKVLNRISYAQSSLRSQEEYEIFQKFVSPSIQNQVAEALYDPILSSNPVFSNERGLLKFLLRKIKIRFTRDEEEIITEGQESNAIYFLISGEMKVTGMNHKKLKMEKICYLKPGSHFGEIGLIYKTQRRATVASEEYSTIAELTKKDFKILTSSNPGIIPKLREFTEFYNDPLKQFLNTSMLTQRYFKFLPKNVFFELPFFMQPLKIEKGSYLYKPGDSPSCLYVLIEGSLELSVTINDHYIQHLKIIEGYADINTLIKSSRTKTPRNYDNRHFDIFTVDGLKRKTEIFPYIKSNGKIACTKNQDSIPLDAQKIGNFLQEIILMTIKPGALINSRNFLINEPVLLQCKAVETCHLYTLEGSILTNYAKKFEDFNLELTEIRKNAYDDVKKEITKNIDVEIQEEVKNKKILLKESILRVIFLNRIELRRQSKNLLGLTRKIRAIISCEEAGNFELADKVVNGEILPEYICEDGRLMTNKDLDTAQLPENHPIISKFKKSLDEMANPNSTSITDYNQFATGLLNELEKSEKTKKELIEIKESLTNYVNKFQINSGPATAFKKNLLDTLEFPKKTEAYKKNLLFPVNK